MPNNSNHIKLILEAGLAGLKRWWWGLNRFARWWIIGVGVAAMLYLFCLPRRMFDQPCSTVVADRNGELLGARIADDGQWRFPGCDTVPSKFRECVIEFEDRHFYIHRGVDPIAVARALWQNAKAGRVVSGGSTITMQVVRLSRGRKRTVGEKIIEVILATRLEVSYTKDEILALYASNAPFGGNVVGLDAAAWRYFGHPADRMSWAESATLAVLPNAPSMLHLSKNRPALLAKRNRLLKRLLEAGKIDRSTCALAIEEPLPGEPLPLPQSAPHLISLIAQQREGEYCVSSIDAGMQNMVESVLARWNAEFIRSDIRNMAAIVVDVSTGEVTAYAGNVNFSNGSSANQVDIIRSQRSSGSILKPLLYCAMMESGDLLPHTLVADIPVNIKGFAPRNFNLQYDGAVPASEALARSLNVPAVGMLRQYGIPKFHSFLKKSGIKTLSKSASHYGLSLILGGAEVTLWDIAGAYTNMARTINDQSPVRISTLLYEGREMMQVKKQALKAMPYKAGAAWLTMEAIKEVNRPEEIDWHTIPSMQTIGWKTGTSYGLRDGWAVGATPSYVVGVWVGNSNGEGKPGLTGASTAGPVMFDIFNSLPYSRWFERPDDELTENIVCRQSGYLAGPNCMDQDTILTCPAAHRSTACPYHIEVLVSADEKYRVTADMPTDPDRPPVMRSWFVLPTAMEWYYRQRHPAYRPLPPPATTDSDGFTPMQFIYPQQGARLTLPVAHDGTKQPIVMRVAHSYPDAYGYRVAVIIYRR